jgi:hypothetical protein
MKLSVPTEAFRYENKDGKYHLVNPRTSGSVPQSVCGFILWKDSTVKAKIEDLPAARICQSCLGAMTAK